MNELISLIEGAAPTIASALVPGPLSGPVGSLAGVAIAHLAEGLGLPHPAEPADIINALSNLASPAVKDAVLSRAESNFQTTLAPVLPATQEPSAPATAPTTGEPDVSTHHGVTMDLPTMIVFMMLSTLSGWLASRGVSLQGFGQALTGSTDLHVAAAMLVGSVTAMYRSVSGSNKNTAALVSASKA
jgi:hypothetical protein